MTVSNRGVEQAFRPALKAINTSALAAEAKLLTVFLPQWLKPGMIETETAGLKACSTLHRTQQLWNYFRTNLSRDKVTGCSQI
jgi:hypothetical protein